MTEVLNPHYADELSTAPIIGFKKSGETGTAPSIKYSLWEKQSRAHYWESL